MNGGTISPAEFFAPESVAAMTAAVSAAARPDSIRSGIGAA
jgi:hypothetical protein